LSVNDTSLTIIEIHFENGSAVKKGDLLMVFETSKTTYDVHSETDGFIKILASKNCDYEVNTTIAQIYSVKEEVEAFEEKKLLPAILQNSSIENFVPALEVAKDFLGSAIISNAAKELLKELDVDPAIFNGSDIVTTDDVLRKIGRKTDPQNFQFYRKIS
jgi:pyruvate/2-oxoglutarate dehydrogenase complex dihydrolipoamide acyltransferase (E2) component